MCEIDVNMCNPLFILLMFNNRSEFWALNKKDEIVMEASKTRILIRGEKAVGVKNDRIKRSLGIVDVCIDGLI